VCPQYIRTDLRACQPTTKRHQKYYDDL